MKAVYRVLASLIAGLVMLQGALIAFAGFGENQYIDQGGVIDKATVEAAMESGVLPFTGVYGFIFHSQLGQFVIPVLALVLLIVSFFAKVTKGPLLAGIIFGLVVVQVAFGLIQIPILGFLHGLLAFALFAMAMVAASRAKEPSAAGTSVGAR